MKIRFKDLIESSLSRIWKHAKGHDSGTISAFRSAKECLTGISINRKDNRSNNRILKANLLKLGYGVTSIKGSYIENYKSPNAKHVDEESFFVSDYQDKGDLKKNLIKLGQLFNQDSITYSKKSGEYYLISSNNCPEAYPGFGVVGKELKLGKPIFGKDGEFYSKINGRPFVFESIDKSKEYRLRNFYPTEIRSILMLAEKEIIK